jgi:pteridine reductase
MKLQGAVVLITGGRRVGSALALMLADRGARVALTYHTSRAKIESTVAEITANGGEATAFEANLADASQAESAVEQVSAKFGRIDALVNMASIYTKTPFDDLKPADFDAMIAANLAGPYHTAVATARQMKRQSLRDGIKGKIINIGDWATDRPYRDYLPYLVAKGGLTTFTLALAKELAPEIAVNMVQPAMIDPPPHLTTEEAQAIVDQIPLGHSGVPSDANNLILYLLEGTDFATGGLFRIDGGRFLGS